MFEIHHFLSIECYNLITHTDVFLFIRNRLISTVLGSSDQNVKNSLVDFCRMSMQEMELMSLENIEYTNMEDIPFVKELLDLTP